MSGQETPPGLPKPAEAYGFLALMRLLERRAEEKPPIGKNRNVAEEIVSIGQDPSLAFLETDLSNIGSHRGRLDVRAQFLGFFGPQGALPLNTTEEVLQWFQLGDDAFVRFTDIFASRFLQLYFRAWSDARAITQFDHPTGDRFSAYVGALAGIGTPAYRSRDRVDDIVKMPMVGLHAARVKSPVRLRQMLALHLQAEVSVEEHLPSWMEFDASSQNRLGQRGSTLGRDMHLGSRVQTVNEKICIHIRAHSLECYRRFLPTGQDYPSLKDIVFWYLGKTMEVEVALSLPSAEIPVAALGKTVELRWMACMAPKHDEMSDFVEATRFRLDVGSAQAA